MSWYRVGGDLPAAVPSRRQLWLGCALLVVVGAAAMLYLNGSGLTSGSKYHTDLTQSPHWFAHHGDRFAGDDLLVEYATFNESPVQNLIYRVGTWFVDPVLLSKLVGVAIFGLTAGLFFGLVSSMSGLRTGVLAGLFYIIFPRATYETAAGFSKGWAIGFVLLAVYIVETRRWRVLLWTMAPAALAYPVAPVLMGAIVFIGIALEFTRDRAEAFAGLKWLSAGSALALIPLLYKYFTPPDRIGEMISTAQMKAMWEAGYSSSYTWPLWEEVYSYLEHPFFIYAPILLLMLLCRRGLVWKRSWSALLIGSTIGYYVADLVVPQLYLPDRYSRFSVAVLLVLWLAHNWNRLLEGLTRPWARRATAAAVVLLAALSFTETFRPCEGEQSQGLWEDKVWVEQLNASIEALPSPVLVAGHPYYTAETVVQARQPVLVINRMFHPWFVDYREEMQTRIRNTFLALYAREVRDVNDLAERYGVTHLIVRKQHYRGSRFRDGRVYRKEFEKFIAGLTVGRGRFVLNPPPRDSILFEDRNFWLVRLPLDDPDRPPG